MYALLVFLVVIPAQGGRESGTPGTRPVPRVRERKLDATLLWNEIALEAIREDRTPPPIGARNLALLHVAIHDTVNTIYQSYRPYRVSLRATEPIDPELAAAAAAHRVLSLVYPQQSRRFTTALDRARAAVTVEKDRSRAEKLGRYVADRLIVWRTADARYREGSYRAAATVGIWRPTLPKNAAAMLPDWGNAPLFGVSDRDRYRPPAPPAVKSTAYTQDFQEVKRLGGRSSARRTAEQSIIAWFWDDGAGTSTPPGHWNQIAREAALQRNLQLPETARLFALLNVAMADAGLLCWDCKYRFRMWRPITAIREAERDGNPDTAAESGWVSLLDTPPFPAYTSGHSTFSAAAATVLTQVFGKEDLEITVGSDGFPGTERTFKTFWNAAREAGQSRIYGGIHFQSDNRAGLTLGQAIAEEILRTHLRPEDATGGGSQ